MSQRENNSEGRLHDRSALLPATWPSPSYGVEWAISPTLPSQDTGTFPGWVFAPLDDLERSFVDDDGGDLVPSTNNPTAPPATLPQEPVPHADGTIDIPSHIPCKHRCAGNVIGPHNCIWNGRRLVISCTTCLKVYQRKNDFNRHYRTSHDKTVYHCPFPGCNSVFSRLDNVNPHRRAIHKEYIPERRVAPPGSKKSRARMQEAARVVPNDAVAGDMGAAE